MVAIYNGTSHNISIYSIDDTYAIQDGRKLVLKPNAVAIAIIPPGKNLNCVKANSEAPTFEIEGLLNPGTSESVIKKQFWFFGHSLIISLEQGFSILLLTKEPPSSIDEAPQP